MRLSHVSTCFNVKCVCVCHLLTCSFKSVRLSHVSTCVNIKCVCPLLTCSFLKVCASHVPKCLIVKCVRARLDSVARDRAHQRRHPGGRAGEDGGGADEPGRPAAPGVPRRRRPVPEGAAQPAAAEPGGTPTPTPALHGPAVPIPIPLSEMPPIPILI